MQFRKDKKAFVIKLSKGEKIVESLTEFCRKNKIDFAVFYGIGAVLNADIGFYDLKKKSYFFKKINKPLEITSLIGNISLLNKKHALHAHITLSDERMRAIGGHLKEATVGGTCEIILVEFKTKIKRTYDEETGLNLWDL